MLIYKGNMKQHFAAQMLEDVVEYFAGKLHVIFLAAVRSQSVVCNILHKLNKLRSWGCVSGTKKCSI